MKLIKLQDKFILVNDEEIKAGDYMLYKSTFLDGTVKSYNDYQKADWIIQKVTIGDLPYVARAENGKNAQAGLKGLHKIIAGISELPSIDFSLLSEEDCKTIGWIDVEKLANDWNYNQTKEEFGKPHTAPSRIKAFKKGFKTAQSLNDKMFSEVEMREAISQTRKGMLYNKKYEDEYIQSLQQTSWNVEVEMESYVSEHIPWGKELESKYEFEKGYPVTKSIPKITNNSIKIIKIL